MENLTNRKKDSALFLTVINRLLLLAIFGTLAACVDKTVQRPSNILPEEKMVQILVDMHVVEGARSGTLVLGDTNDLPDYYAKIYQKHGLKPIEFKESFFWYSHNPEALRDVYDEVIVALSKMEEEVNAEKTKAEKDSVK